jgi:hypothetical protein
VEHVPDKREAAGASPASTIIVNDERRNAENDEFKTPQRLSFIIHRSWFTVHHSSFIVHDSSSIIHHS